MPNTWYPVPGTWYPIGITRTKYVVFEDEIENYPFFLICGQRLLLAPRLDTLGHLHFNTLQPIGHRYASQNISLYPISIYLTMGGVNDAYYYWPLIVCSINLKVFIEEACPLHHPQFLCLVIFSKEGELLGEGRAQLVVRGAQLRHLHLRRVCWKTVWGICHKCNQTHRQSSF